MKYLSGSIAFLAIGLALASPPAPGQTTNSVCDQIAKLDSDVHEYLWPRWQDDELTAVDRRILRLRTKAIPLLIGCLADERGTTVHGERWAEPSVGTVAFSMLWDLFTACDHYDEDGYGVDCRHSIARVITWDELCAEGAPQVAFPCAAGWYEHLKKYGRRSIQQSWQKAWTENKDRIYWDERAKCFRVKKTR